MGNWVERSASSKPTLLIVDDSDLDLRQWRGYFEIHGWDVSTAKAGDDFQTVQELSQVIAQRKPAAILTDHEMGMVNGLGTLSAAKSAGSTAPIILHSGNLDSVAADAGKPAALLVNPDQFAGVFNKGTTARIDATFRKCLAAQSPPQL